MKQESAQNGGKEEGDKHMVEGKMKRDLADAGDSDDESPGAALLVAKKAKLGANRQCPYLDTIDRGVLDFDFEKLCSVSCPGSTATRASCVGSISRWGRISYNNTAYSSLANKCVDLSFI